MTALDKLKDDHKLIRRYLDNISIAHDFLVDRETVPESVVDKIIEFSKIFMNKYHHFREEYILFIHLAKKKGGEIDPQIVSLRDQHERSRNLVSQIKSAKKGYAKGEEVATTQLVENFGYYVSLERQHIGRENHVFYPMAEQTFSDEDMGLMDSEFKDFEDKQVMDLFKEGVRLVEELEGDMKEKFGAKYRDRYEDMVAAHHHSK